MRREGESESQTLARVSTGQTTAAISQAMADLNRSGRVVTEQGTLTIAGETIWLRVRKGQIVAVPPDGIEIPWSHFRRILPRRRP